MRILVHCGPARGGIADYAVRQANALIAAGNEVIFLAPVNFDKDLRAEVRFLPILPDLDARPRWPGIRQATFVAMTLAAWRQTAQTVAREKPDTVLLAAFAEYLAPIWSYRLRRLRARTPIPFGAVFHDPVRARWGPAWWHRWSLHCASRILDVAFVHSPAELDLPTVLIPHGVYEFPDAQTPRSETRKRLGIEERAILLFAFGHVRDSKNLDLAVRLLAGFPELHLVIAGPAGSSHDRPPAFYENLARELNVGNRLTVMGGHLPSQEAADLFSAADLVFLGYDRGFVSASGVLHVAIQFRKPALASSGPGHLQWAMERYRLGVWVPPDSLEAIETGLRQLLEGGDALQPRWEDYEAENTWERNAELVVEAFQRIKEPG